MFEHFRSLNLKPNAITFLLLVDAHLVAKDPKAALSVIDEMVLEFSLGTSWLQSFLFALGIWIDMLFNNVQTAGNCRISTTKGDSKKD